MKRSLMRMGVVLALVALVGGCATTKQGRVLAKVTLYRGEDLQDLKGVTFDGETFSRLPGGKSVSRNDVQVVQFQVKGRKGATGGAAAAGEGLTSLAQGLLERGQAMGQTYPGVSGVILVDDGEFVYHRDGTSVYRYHFAGLVLKEEKKSWAEVACDFEEGRSRVRLLFARTVNGDGSVKTLPPDALQVSSPSEEMEFFNPNRKMLSGVIPGVEVGSVVEYGYEYEDYNPEDPRLFSPGYYFQGTEPVVYSRAVVRAPKDVPFQYVTRHFSEGQQAEPVVEEQGDVRTYTWVVEDVPPIIPEPMMPPERDVAPMMDSSVFGSFQEVYDLLAGLQKPRMTLTPAIEAKVSEIAEGAQTAEEKLARIYHWVQENTRYISIKGGLGSGMSGHTAQETFENRYGDCTDKAILLATMCKAIGVTAYPIILVTNDAGVGITEIPTLGGNHAITEVELDGRSFYLDTTAQDYRYPYFRADDHGAFAMNAVRGDIRPIPVPPPSDNRRLSRLDVTLAANGDVTVRTRNEYNGTVEAGVRSFWKRTREDNRKAMMAEYVNSISPGAVLDEFTLSDLNDLSQPLVMTIDYTLAGHAIRAKDLMYLRMPTLERDYAEAALETRTYPIQYMTTEERILEIELALPPGFHAKWLPPPLAISNAYLEYQAGYEERDGKIVFREDFRRLQRIVPTADYPAYRDALRAIAEFSKKEIFVTAAQPAGGQARRAKEG
jgi:transglutaminase-like putative cysteine protease